MSEIRFDPVTGRNVIIAEKRADRPSEFQQLEFRRTEAICPFCRGNEDATPEPIATWDAQGKLTLENSGDDWIVRVVPNKYPALIMEDSFTGEKRVEKASGPYTRESVCGSHELVIETPKHYASWSQLSDLELRLTMEAIRYRVAAHSQCDQIGYTSVFKNCRPAAGASLEHAHTQILGMSSVPEYLSAFARRNEAHEQANGITLVESITRWEIQERRRVLIESDLFTAYCPYASRFPYQIWIAPNRAITPFEQMDQISLGQLAALSRNCIRNIELLLDFPAYNWVLYLPPFDKRFNQANWLVEIFPRTSRQAGFEMQTDCWINQTPPETAASQLRVIDE
jgi:UDPglucose--hexose-1-phosphate uridylyltransferase